MKTERDMYKTRRGFDGSGNVPNGVRRGITYLYLRFLAVSDTKTSDPQGILQEQGHCLTRLLIGIVLFDSNRTAARDTRARLVAP